MPLVHVPHIPRIDEGHEAAASSRAASLEIRREGPGVFTRRYSSPFGSVPNLADRANWNVEPRIANTPLDLRPLLCDTIETNCV
jgi:hypothetical protein